MNDYELYVLVLCLIVYIALTALFSIMAVVIYRQSVKLMQIGVEDEKIKTEYLKERAKRKSVLGVIEKVIPIITCIVLCVFFVFSIVVNVGEKNYVGNIPSFKIVSSGSMSTKYKGNEYLFKENLDNQLQIYDLVLVHKLPEEKDLKLYDIVVYEVDGILLIHRIVGIEEPNTQHSERYFLLQGDAVQYPDRFPVLYSQMRGVYQNQKVPMLGSFVIFMQSTAGYLCVLLMAFAAIAMPVLEKRYNKHKKARLVVMGIIDENGNYIEPIAVTEQVDTVPYHSFKKGKGLTFNEKLQNAPLLTQERYAAIKEHILSAGGVSLIESKTHHALKQGRNRIAKISLSGKTLRVYLPLNPDEYADSKYKFTSVEGVKAHANYPMLIKLTSDRKVKHAKELIDLNLVRQEKPLTDEERLARLKRTRAKSFKYKLRLAPKQTKIYYKQITEYALTLTGVKLRESKKHHTLYKGRKLVAKISLRGKTLRVYLPLNPTEYVGSKYKFTSVQGVKAHENNPMLFKITSDRKAKHVKELIDNIVKD